MPAVTRSLISDVSSSGIAPMIVNIARPKGSILDMDDIPSPKSRSNALRKRRMIPFYTSPQLTPVPGVLGILGPRMPFKPRFKFIDDPSLCFS